MFNSGAYSIYKGDVEVTWNDPHYYCFILILWCISITDNRFFKDILNIILII